MPNRRFHAGRQHAGKFTRLDKPEAIPQTDTAIATRRATERVNSANRTCITQRGQRLQVAHAKARALGAGRKSGSTLR
jgi:hypothetical protein